MEDRPPFDIGTKNWAPAHGLHSTVKISDSARRSQLLRAGHHRAWHLILICHFKLLEERWAKLAQLFAFYWDLTRNKFSFPLNAFLTRSPSLIKFYSDAILESSRKVDWNHWEYRSRSRITNLEEGRTANPRGRFHPPYHLCSRRWYSGTLQKLVVISNVKLKGKWILFREH